MIGVALRIPAIARSLSGALAWLSAWFTTAIAKTIVDKVLFFLALKAILSFLFMIVAPIVLNNLLYDLMEIVKNYLIAAAGDVGSFDGAMQFTGFLAWLSDCFNITECVSIVVSALQFRLALNCIPFVGRMI